MKKLSNDLRAEALDRLRKGQSPKQVAKSLEVDLLVVEQLNAKVWEIKYHDSQRHVNNLKAEVGKLGKVETDNRKLKHEVESLKNQLLQLQPAIESVNSLTAERSKLMRKLKRAGVKL